MIFKTRVVTVYLIFMISAGVCVAQNRSGHLSKETTTPNSTFMRQSQTLRQPQRRAESE